MLSLEVRSLTMGSESQSILYCGSRSGKMKGIFPGQHGKVPLKCPHKWFIVKPVQCSSKKTIKLKNTLQSGGGQRSLKVVVS